MEDQGRGRKDHHHGDNPEFPPLNRFSAWEEQLFHDADIEASFEAQVNNYQIHASQKLWASFQATAAAIAQLYKDRHGANDSAWIPFQNAAASTTNMYKESLEMTRTTKDVAIQCGYQRRNKELIAWARKKKRNIRREELISFLCGRSPPHRMISSTRTPRPPPALPGHSKEARTQEQDLQQFQEAVSMHGLSGAMAGISVRSHPGSPNQRQHRSSAGGHGDLTNFIAEEFRRRRNETTTPSTSENRGRSTSPSVSSRKRNPSSDSSNSDCSAVAKKPKT